MKNTKKLVSVFLAAVMLISLLPTVSFASGDTRETITLNLHRDNLREKNADGTESELTRTAEASNANNSAFIANLVFKDGKYEWVTDKSVKDLEMSVANNSYGSFGYRMQYQTRAQLEGEPSTDKSWEAWPFFGTAQNMMFTVKTKIPEGAGGYYKVKITGAPGTGGGEFAVYAGEKYVGDFNSYSSGTTHTVWELDNAVDLPAGDVEISLRAVKFYRERKDTQDNNASIYLGLIELIPAKKSGILEVESALPETIQINESLDLTARVKMDDGAYRAFGYTDKGELPEADNIIKVTSSDSEVIEVTDVVCVERNDPKNREQTLDPTTTTFALNAKKAGSADITVTAIVDGETKELKKTIQVVKPRVLETVEVSFDKNPVPATRTTKAELNLIGDDGEEYTNEHSVVYSSSDTEVAEIAADGSITTHKKGTTDITTAVTTDKGTVSGTATLTVSDEPVLDSFALKASKKVLIGDTTHVSVISTTMDDELEGNASDYTFTFKGSNDAVATVSADGAVTGVSKGKVKVTATALNENGKEITAGAEIEVIATRETINLDLHMANLAKKNADGTVTPLVHGNAPLISELVVLDEGYEWVADKSVTQAIATGNNSSGKGRRMQYATQLVNSWEVWPDCENEQEQTFTIKREISAGEAGYYSIQIDSAVSNVGGVFSVYADGQYAGDFNSYADISSATAKSQTLNTVYISEGEAEISFRARKLYRGRLETQSNNASLYLGDVKLVPAEKPSIISLESDIPGKLPNGETVELSAEVRMSDGTYRHFGYTASGEVPKGDNLITVTSSDPEAVEVVAVEVAEENDPKNRDQVVDSASVVYKLRAKKLDATADITVKAYVDGETQEFKTTVKTVVPPVLNNVGISFEKSPVPATRSTKATLSLTRDDGSEYPGEYSVKYESSDKSVAEIDENGNIITHKKGTAEISATVTTVATEATASVTVTGTKALVVSSVPVLGSLTLSSKKRQLLIGETTNAYAVGAIMDDGIEGTLSDYEKGITYSSADESIIKVTPDGSVTGIAKGKADVIATVKNENGKEVNGRVTIEVHEVIPSFTVDFTQTVHNADYKAFPPSTPGYTIIQELSNAGTYRKYRYNDTGRELLHVSAGSPTKLWPADTSQSTAFAISVDVPFESDYSISLIGGKSYIGAVYSVFVDGEYIGDHSFWSGSYEADTRYTGEPNVLNTVHLTEAAHTIVFRARATYYESTWLTLDSLVFTPLSEKNELSHIEAEIPTELAVGETFDSEVTAYMSDGTVRRFGPDSNGAIDAVNSLIPTSSASAVEISGYSQYILAGDGTHPFTLKGASVGISNVGFTATVNGKSVEKIVPVNVTEDPIVSTTAKTEASELFANDKTRLIAQPKLKSGRVTTTSAITTVYESENPGVATVEGNMLSTHAEGTARIKVTSTFNGDTVVGYADITVLPEGMTDITATAGGSKYIRTTGIEGDTVPLYVQSISNLGRELDMEGAIITAKALTPEIADIDSRLNIIPVYADPENTSEARFEVAVEMPDGRIREKEISLTAISPKTKATYLTAETVKNARENYKKYDWVKNEVKSSHLDYADKWIDKLDQLYDMIPSEGIPRSIYVGTPSDPNTPICRYCGEDIRSKYGTYPWAYNIASRPWKIQCPDCKRLFPTNDFGSFYELGLNEYREFDRARALARHHNMLHHGSADAACECIPPEKEGSAEWNEYYGYGNPDGYLYNELYSDLENVKTLTGGVGLRAGESNSTWGVDDGYGYIPRDEDGEPYTDLTGVPERHTYIAYYTHWPVFRYTCRYVIRNFSYAYLYTGDVKYGRAAAILLDRIADFYPDYNFKWGSDMLGRKVEGKTVDFIWETEHVWTYAEAYDIVFDLYEDPYVLDYIKEKSKTIKMKYAKETPSQLRTHIEDGILRTAFESELNGRLNGNFGYDQKAIATAAVVLDTMPETKNWIEYNFLPGWQQYNPTGGGIYETVMKRVDSDGMADEASGGYNPTWLKNLIGVETVLEKYDRYKAASIYNIPKYTQMFYALLPVICTDYSAHIGDTYSTCAETHWITQEHALEGFRHFKDPVFAQVLYMLNGNSSKGLHYAATEKDPERLEDEVQAVIDEYGVLNLDSEMMTNFGYSILRDGGDFTNSTTTTQDDTRRNVWMYYGNNNGHGHRDTLNLGMSAFGLNIMPDLGYPAQTGTPPERMQWIEATLSHNTVSVDEKWQDLDSETRGKAKHFDDAGMVQLMDVSTPYVYSNVEEYRRSVVMIKADDTNSYYVDFFRVLGGKDHVYSLHASSDEIAGTEGLTLVPQMKDGKYAGTYAGINIPYGADPNSPDEWVYDTVYPRGYTWLENVDRDEEPESKFEVDFAIKDFNKAITNNKGLHLRMTVLNDGNIKNGVDTSVAIADGYAPKTAANKNIPKLKYVLLKHTGKNLDTTFTTVFEPYRTNKFIKSADELDAEICSGYEKTGDAHRALRIEHTSGRVDYVFWSTNRDVTYKVSVDDREIFFRGFVGVYTIQNGENTYKYVNDGDIIGEADETTGEPSVITGTVEDFTKDYVLDNEIIIKPSPAVSQETVNALSGRYIHIDNGTERSGSFKIEGADFADDGSGNIVLDIGGVTPIRNYIDAKNMDKGFTYMIAEGQSARIPLSYSEDFAPEFAPVSGSLTTSAGSSISVTVSATSPKDHSITYEAEMLPRGASLNADTGVITWKPDSSQIGDNHFAITAVDDLGRESTIHFYVTVYGSTTSKPSADTSAEETPSGGGGASGGTAGGGGTTTTPSTTDTDTESLPLEGKVPSEGEADEVENVRFIDLGNHAWAADAINSLADAGIVRGTTATTYSPAANITRADFALLLVRAFELSSDNTENFADVSADDYFAPELAVARNTGIVNGIGDNKYAPRNTITRQDMMTIVYRALNANPVGRGLAPAEYPDWDSVAPYAHDAVSHLIANGIVNGKNGLIAPTDYTTRAEVAVLIKRILDYIK